MIEVRVTLGEQMQMSSPVQLHALLAERGIKFNRRRLFSVAEDKDMAVPWRWWRDPETGDLIVQQGDV